MRANESDAHRHYFDTGTAGWAAASKYDTHSCATLSHGHSLVKQQMCCTWVKTAVETEMGALNLQDRKMTHNITGVENTGLEIDGQKFSRQK